MSHLHMMLTMKTIAVKGKQDRNMFLITVQSVRAG